MAIESMVMGEAGVTALVMVGEVCGRWRRGSRSYSYVGRGFLRAFPPERISWIPVNRNLAIAGYPRPFLIEGSLMPQINRTALLSSDGGTSVQSILSLRA